MSGAGAGPRTFVLAKDHTHFRAYLIDTNQAPSRDLVYLHTRDQLRGYLPSQARVVLYADSWFHHPDADEIVTLARRLGLEITTTPDYRAERAGRTTP